MSKTQKKLDLNDDWEDSDDDDQYEDTLSDRLREKRDKLLRSTELRRKIEDRLESRRLRDQFGDFDSFSF
ncbi:MAG: hypothetical protein ACI843_002325 [Psychrobacter glaciei]